jgi:hypothetical protein
MKKWSRLLLVVGIIILGNYSVFAKSAQPFEVFRTGTLIKKMIDHGRWYGIKSLSGRYFVSMKSYQDQVLKTGTIGLSVRIRSLLLRSESLVRRGKLLKTTHYQKN